ncbi:phosphate ABC transporter permease subunit PstC [Novipirellula artificiosorum]|uniref:Phosphate transport system permease protein n=1 Tax=Novipirellula artificiosorum TaxID=2528016 RepID=A0A5C6E1K6_9BACT|nr:phosphate ABC transporter permease subunit PstC [Novipirellula artificiosorum]TWU42738.1 Phosphate transport system permease protein PstC [Novipirellula artificiosorum]
MSTVMETHVPAEERIRSFFVRPRRSLATVRLKEKAIFFVLICCGIFSVLITIAIIGVLLSETITFFGFEEVSLKNFLGSAQWTPLLGATKSFGIWGLISGTLLITAIAMCFALPLGLITAVYLSEYAPRRVRSVLKPVLEVLAGIPTVVYGFFALTTITPILQWLHGGFNVYNAMSAGIAVGILCFPTVCSLAEDALQAVPSSLRDAAYGLGGTRFDTSVKVIVPAALSGIISAFLLAIARAIGETMIVALAAGSRPQMTLDPRDEIQTMTGFMVQMAGGDVSNFGTEYYSMYAVAFTLFVMTLSLTLIGNVIRKRFRETYE